MGGDIDRAIGDLLVATLTPLALEVALSVQDELASRAGEADRLRQQVERARYEAELAQRRYLRVDPDNRLVAATLEAEWNAKLRALDSAQDDYERQRAADTLLEEGKRQQILALATDFPRLWHDPATPARERKRMARLLVEDVTLLRGEEMLDVHVRLRGGQVRSLQLPRPKSVADLAKLGPGIVAEVDRLLDDHTDTEIADALNAAGHQPPVGDRFTIWIIWKIFSDWGVCWGVLGISRLHFTLSTGGITSKTGAGDYALSTFEPTWHPIVNEALGIRRGHRTAGAYGRRPLLRRRQALEFMSHVIDDANPGIR